MTKNNAVVLSGVTYGSDPELFLCERETGKPISAIPVLKGHDKHAPIELKNGVRVYWDNVLVEAAFPPVKTKAAFIGQFREAFQGMQDVLGKKFAIKPQASHLFQREELKDQEAWDIGCSPNYDAYKAAQNDMSEGFTDGLRTGSCHIHLGHKALTKYQTRLDAVKLLDVFVGCASVIFDQDASSQARRKYYGKAGEHRPTPYGLEFRVLSPFVLRSPETVDLVFDLVNYTLLHVLGGHAQDILARVDAKDVKKAINTCNRKLAAKILGQAGLPADLFARVNKAYEGDFYTNWGIKV